MSRVQLALNVADLEASISFYETLFATKPHKLRPGYANFEVANPPLKLVLIEVPTAERGTGPAGALNHLGVEVDDTATVATQTRRLAEAGLNPLEQEQTNCCHAVQDKTWINDPAGAPWEVYTITDDNPESADNPETDDNAEGQQSSCCLPDTSDSDLVVETVGIEGGCGCSEKSSPHDVSVQGAAQKMGDGCCGGQTSAEDEHIELAEREPCCVGAAGR